jgi:glycosyltransferase involved in cell wall biosynthesis
VSRFPKLSETFVLNELLAVEREGVHVELYPLLRERADVVHPAAVAVAERARYQPFLSWPILCSQLHFLRRCPRRYLRTLAALLVGVAGSPNFLAGALGIWPKVVHMARSMTADGVTHVHCHFATHPTVAGWIVQRLVGIPYSFTAHGSDLHVDRRMLPQKVAEAAFVLTVCEYNRDVIVSTCGPQATSKVSVLHCGVDTDVFRPAGPRPGTRPQPSGPLRVLCIGTLHEVKGQRHLLAACRLLMEQGVDVRCTLVGDGPDRRMLSRLIAGWAIAPHVEFAGRRTSDEIAALLMTADVVVAPSVPTREGKREGVPVALMEAMSAAVPVVASRLSGIPELIEDGRNGILIPPGDASALASALRRLHEDPELRECLGSAGRDTVMRKFDLRANAARLTAQFTAPASPRAGEHGSPVLGQALAVDFVVGSNRRGTAGGNWPFLLPELKQERVLCCGRPTLAALRTLSLIARDVLVSPASRPGRALVRAARSQGLRNVRACTLADVEDGTVDVAWLGSRADRGLLDRLDRLLRPDGVVFTEAPTTVLLSRFPTPQVLLTAPRREDLQLAVPESHPLVVTWARGPGSTARSKRAARERPAQAQETTVGEGFLQVSRRWTRAGRREPSYAVIPAIPAISCIRGSLGGRIRGERVLAGSAPARSRRAALVGRALDPSLPAYVLRIAETAGVQLRDRPWVFWSPGRYASKKLLFFVFDRAGERPDVVVRMTRDATLNGRLENEWDALRRLQAAGVGDAETVPQPRFFGYHHSLAILGETAIAGTPFQQRSAGTVDCPYGLAALDWFVMLGTSTAVSFEPEQTARALTWLHDRFTAVYRLEPAHKRVLAAHVAMLGSGVHRLPAVTQHGDPGTWNLMVTPGGRVGVLDWEACEPHGMPLWDLFYFMRSYGVLASRATGTRDPLSGYARQFFARSPLCELAAGAAARLCAGIGLAEELVEPLFFTCWMHRALKESTRLRPGRVDGGHYVRLLTRCLDARGSPGLRRLFSPGRAAPGHSAPEWAQ